MSVYDIIKKKRDGLELSAGEIEFFIDGFFGMDLGVWNYWFICCSQTRQQYILQQYTWLLVRLADRRRLSLFESPVAAIWCLLAELRLVLGVGAFEGHCLSLGMHVVVDLSPLSVPKRLLLLSAYAFRSKWREARKLARSVLSFEWLRLGACWRSFTGLRCRCD